MQWGEGGGRGGLKILKKCGGGVLIDSVVSFQLIYRPLAYGRVYLPFWKMADTPFHIQGDDTVT